LISENLAINLYKVAWRFGAIGELKLGRPHQSMLYSVMFIIVFGAIGLVVFLTATRAAVLQRKIK
jgi:hypothetical protein